MYTELSDASVYNPKYGCGRSEVFYSRNHFTTELEGSRPVFDRNNYVKLGNIASEDLEEIFMLMQGEMWSPNGEANQLIRALGLRHTSMMVGDIIKVKGRFFMCAVGFQEVFEK